MKKNPQCGNMNHSLKPFLLDTLLAWAKASRRTPILSVSAHPSNVVPECLRDVEKMAFNMNNRSVAEQVITTESISFTTHLFDKPDIPQRLFLHVDSWISLRMKETGHVFSFEFPENRDDIFAQWPEGIPLVLKPGKKDFRYSGDSGQGVIGQGMDIWGGTTLGSQHGNENNIDNAEKTVNTARHLKLIVNNDK